MRTFIISAAALLATAGAAAADPIPSGGDFGRGFGMDGDSFDAPIQAGTRDANGNRVIINGRMQLEGTLTGGLQDNFASGLSGQAIGNQLNVITQGNYNTVIVDSTQINNGDISADIDGGN